MERTKDTQNVWPHSHPPHDHWEARTPKQNQNLCLLYWLWISFWFNLAWRTLSKTTGKRDWRETYNLISTMCKNNMCCKNREQTDIISSLFNIYINELAKELNNSTVPGPTLTYSEIMSPLCRWFSHSVKNKRGTTTAPRHHRDFQSNMGS